MLQAQLWKAKQNKVSCFHSLTKYWEYSYDNFLFKAGPKVYNI